jgi:hypothetical protein
VRAKRLGRLSGAGRLRSTAALRASRRSTRNVGGRAPARGAPPAARLV